MSFTSKRVHVLLPALVALAAACGGSNLVLPSEGVAAKIVVVSGDKQAGVVGVALVANIVVRVTDSKDRPVQSQQVTFTPADAGSGQAIPPSATTNADGQASVQWVLGAVAGTQTMLAKAVGNGAPANLSVILTATASSSVPAKLEKAAGDGQTATAGSAVATAPAVKVTDSQGNPVAGVGVTFAVATGGGSVNPTTPVATNASGIAAVTSWTLGAVPGTNTLTATAAGAGITGNPATFTATGVVGAAAKLGFAVAPSTTAASGVALATQPQVQIQDAAGNPVTTANVQVSVAISPGTGTLSGGPTVVQTNASGLAAFSGLTISGTAGPYTLLFTASGLASVSAPVTIGAGNPSGSQSSFSASPASFVAGSITGSTVTVTARDANGNPIAGAAAAVNVTGTNTVLPSPLLLTDATGQTTAMVTSSEAGVKTVTVTINGVAVTNPSSATITVTTGGVSASQSTLSASPSTIVAGSGSSTITVTAKDGFGNPISGATVLLSATGTGNTLTQPGLTAANGQATGSLSSTVVETKTVTATINGTLITASATITVTAGGVSASQSTLSASPTTIVAGSGSSTITVTAKDASGNPISGATVVLSATGSANTVTQPGLTGANGRATGSLSSTVAEGKTVTATINGTLITATATVTVTAGSMSASQSTISASPTTITAGSGSSTITVTAKDAFGNPISGATVVLSATGSGNTLTQPGLTGANGQATGSLSSTVAEAKTVTATINGTPITASASVTVAAGTASQIVFTQQPSNTTAGSVIQPSVTVAIEDALGNTVTSATGSVSVAIGTDPVGGSVLAGTTTVSPVNGVATFSDLTINQAGTGFTLAATFGTLSQTSAGFDIQ